MSAFAVAFGGKADMADGVGNDANDPKRTLNDCGLVRRNLTPEPHFAYLQSLM